MSEGPLRDTVPGSPLVQDDSPFLPGPDAPAAGPPPRERGSLRRALLRWSLPQLILGVVVGLAWWLLAPGGLASSDPGYLSAAESPAADDAWLAVLAVVAGVVVAMVWVSRRSEDPTRGTVDALVGALVGAVVGCAVAWGTGVLIDAVSAAALPPPDATAQTLDTVTADRLRIRAVASPLLWPLALTLVVLVDSVRDLFVREISRSARRIAGARWAVGNRGPGPDAGLS